MNKSLIASIILHTMVICLLIFGLPFHYHRPDTEYAIVIDMVDISELTNIKAQPHKKHKKDQKKPIKNITKALPPQNQRESETPSPPPIKEKIQEKKNPQEVVEKAEKIFEKKTDDTNLKPKKEEQKPQKPNDKEDIEKKKKEDDLFTKAMLKTLETTSQNPEKEKEKEKEKTKPDPKPEFSEEKMLQGETNKDFKPDLPLSLSEKDFIKSQIEKRWNTTAFSGADSLGMQVVLSITLDEEGKVLEVKASHQSSYSPRYQAFVDSAIRAVKIASPLEGLPKDKFNTWKEIKLNFDSSGMVY